MKRVRWPSPRTRCQASAIFSAESTASEPELQKNTWLNGLPASATSRSASSKAIGWPIWKVGAKSSEPAACAIASTIGLRSDPR